MGSCCSSHEPSPPPLETPMAPQPVNPYLNRIHEIDTVEEFDRLVEDPQNANVLIVADFYTTWCQPCMKIAPVISKWASEDYRTDVIFMKINAEKVEDLVYRYPISVLPTFFLFKQGKEIRRLQGADSTALQKEIERFK